MYFEIGVFKWRGRVGVGETYHFSHFHIFHTVIVSFSGSEHTQRYTQTNSDMQRCRSSRPFSFPFNNMVGPNLPQSLLSLRPWWRGEELHLFGTGFKTSEVWLEKLRVKLA